MLMILYRVLLTFNATSLVLVVFLVKSQICLFSGIPNIISYLFYMLMALGLTGVSIFLKQFLKKDDITKEVVEIEVANESFVPTYLGYFFVSLGVEDITSFIIVYCLIFVFTYLSQAIYFNPLFLLFGYKFYYIKTKDSINHFLISKREIRVIKDIKFEKLGRISNISYIDLEKR